MILAWTLFTGYGQWNALAWLGAFIAAFVVALVVRSFGRKDYREGSPQTKPFISGNEEPVAHKLHIPASNLYWGFTEALKHYYKHLVPAHSGILTDYLLWFLGVLVVMIILGLLA